MKIKKGVLTLFLIAALSVAQMPAMAVEVEELLTDEQLYELEYERLLIEGNDDESAISLLSLDDNNTDRTMTISGAIKYYWFAIGNDLSDRVFYEVASPLNFSWQGSGSYKIAQGNESTASNRQVNMTIGSMAGTYVDWSVPSVYVYEEGSTLRFAGVVKSGFAGTWYQTGSFVDYNIAENMGSEIYLPPDRMAIVINGDVVTSVNAGSDGSFQFDYTYPMTETVTNVAYRFYYDETEKAPMYMTNTMGISTRGLWFCIDDNAFAKYVVPDAATVVNKQILEQVKLIPSTIYNFFFGDDGDSASSAFKSSVDSAISSGEAVRDEFSQMEKPEPEDIVPDVDQYAPLDQYTAYTDTFGALMENDTIVSLMMVSLGFAFLGYVFFGKRA